MREVFLFSLPLNLHLRLRLSRFTDENSFPMSVLENPGPGERVLMFAPHPDDESLAAGGLLQRAAQVGAAVRVVFLTNGDNNPWPQRVLERRWRIGATERARWGGRRREEAIAALEALGLPPDCGRFLNLPDQGITPLLLSGPEPLSARMALEIAEFKPHLIVTPALTDIHRDHNAAAVLFRLALNRVSGEQRNFSEINFIIHRKQDGISPRADCELRLSPAEQERKRRAILCHATQMKLSRRRFLAFARPTEVFSLCPPPTERDDRHPVRSACSDGENLRLELRRGSLQTTLFSARILYLVADDLRDGRWGRTLTLPARSAAINALDSASGAVVASARFRASGESDEVLIPLSAFASARRLFVKLENRSGFCDAAGWREILLPATGSVSPSTPGAPLSAESASLARQASGQREN